MGNSKFRLVGSAKSSVGISSSRTIVTIATGVALFAGIMTILAIEEDPPVNDDLANATVITDFNEWCSTEAEYTTIGATADESTSSCFGSGPSTNVWFKFQATSKDIHIQMKTGDTEGTLRYGYLSLWDDSNNEITCASYISSTSDLTISNNNLTIGDWYYISVDNHAGSSGYKGTFTLCVNAGLDYDWQEAAEELSDFNNWCSADAEYSTEWATADESASSCFSSGPSTNRWFKFQATSKDIFIQMKTGDSEGTLRYGYLTLWDDSNNEITCASYISSTSDLTISNNNLTIGDWYYISVDNHAGSSGYKGTFTLCVNSGLDYDWQEAAEELSDFNDWCSADAEYSTEWATADESASSCFGSGPSTNRWFKFQATSKDIFIQMKTGDSEGTLRYGYLTLWDDSNNEITCASYISSTSDLTISNNNLTIGDWYYISVDNHAGSSGYKGTFTLCVNAGLDYDWQEAAEELTDFNDWCSADAEYSTEWATADESASSCFGSGPSTNRWFKFQATSKDIFIQMKTGGSEGTLRYGYLSLWDDSNNEITCASYISSTSDLTISNNNLTIGDWYYISVDNHAGSSGYKGTFTLCVNAGLDYDWQEAAEELTDFNDWCSADAEYSTEWATADESASSCFGSGPSTNRWFKFQATSKDIFIQMKTGGSEGTLRYGYLSLWDDSNNEITCASYISSTSDLTISNNNLTIGDWYYISVDNHAGSSGYKGTFTLCVNAGLDYDWQEAAEELTDLNSWTSSLEAYSTEWATGDESQGSCWNTGTNSNRWFTFLASSTNIDISLLTGSDEGTLRYGYVSLWDDLGNEISCGEYTSSTSDVSITSTGLVVGDRYYISIDNHSGSSGYRGSFSLYINSTSSLPVGFLDFYGEADQSGIHLGWMTVTELNNELFTVERSVDGQIFDRIGEVPGAGTSTVPLDYEYYDLGFAGNTMFYRLKQTDFNGTFSYSNTIEISLPTSMITSVSPNPFMNNLTISYSLPDPSNVELSLVDMKGNVVDQVMMSGQAGSNMFNWGINNNLSSGIYLLKIKAPGQAAQFKKVLKS